MRGSLLKTLPGLLLLIGMSAYVYFQFQDFFACPSCYLFIDGGDGLKNYYTAAYYIKHDAFGLWSYSMNYPYGEHIVYTDNQPIISMGLKLLNSIFDFSPHAIGTINMFAILSLIACALCLFFILRRLGLPRWYAALMSIPITLLSPQIARFNGHYSLAYAFYLPFFLLLFMRWAQSDFRLKKGVFCGLWVAFMGFTHLYYFFIAVVFLIIFGFVHWALRAFRWNRVTARTAVLALATAVVVYGTVKLTDPVEDRPETVYGLYVYTAKPKGTFLPWYPPMDKVWPKFSETRPNIEGTAYLGAPVVILFLPIVLWLVVMIRRRYLLRRIRDRGRTRLNRDPVNPVILASTGVLVWLVATGWIYSLGAGLLVDVFPVIGQFRSLGRVAWMFYYLFGICTAYAMYSIVHAKEARWKSIALTVVFGMATVVWIYEGHLYITAETAGKARLKNQTFRGAEPYLDGLHANGYTLDDFQAIFLLPLQSVGGEKYHVNRGAWYIREAYQCAWETGLPIIPVNMSRTSVSQSLDLVQMLSEPWIAKERLDEMDDRPLLLIASADPKPRVPAENRILAQADSIGTHNDVVFYSLPLNVFKVSEPKPDYQYLKYEDFEKVEAPHAFEGEGALLTETNMQEFFSFRDTFLNRDFIVFEMWSHIGPTTPVFVNTRHSIQNTNGDVVYERDYNMFNYQPVNVIGNWIQTSFVLQVDGSGATHHFLADPPGSIIDAAGIRY